MIGAIASADARIRFRRVSTVIAFLILSALAYFWVPDPSTGRALMRIGGRRALYNSAAIGMATAILGTLFVCLGGYYVISNAIRRDIQSRCGFVIAATSLRNGQYIVGKFLGNVLFLTTFFAGFMLVSMAMIVVRGEAPLEPLIFLRQYLLIAPPPIVFVSALALVFESIPVLSGRIGDVLYFFLFMGLLGAGTAGAMGGATWAAYIDPSGMAAVLVQTTSMMHTTSLAIGAGPFDPRLPPVVYSGVSASGGFVLQRVISMLLPLPLLLVARMSFHRFDPARVRVAASEERRWLSRINAIVKPVTRRIFALAARSSGSLFAAAAVDALMTVTLTPTIGLLIIASLIAGVRWSIVSFVIAGIAISDVACRDFQHGTLSLVDAVPRLREHFVVWKFLSSLIIAAAMLATAAVHTSIAALAVGILFVTSAATMFGMISRNAKAFIVLFLSFWYVVLSDRGHTPALDFGGFYGVPSVRVTLTYAGLAVAFFATAQAMNRLRIQ
jgi:hypothetical protein